MHPPNSDSFKFDKVLCHNCNTTKSQKFDFAYDKFIKEIAFSDSIRQKVYKRQRGICVKCGEHFELNQMEADHIRPWRENGKITEENCQMLCKQDNRIKSGK